MKRVVTAILLLHAVLPLLAVGTSRDPHACCRTKAAHGCFLAKRGRVAPGERVMTSRSAQCASARAVATADTVVVPRGAARLVVETVDCGVVALAAAAPRDRGRDVESARAPPSRA